MTDAVRVAVPEDLDVVLALMDALVKEDAGSHDPAFDLRWVGEHGRAEIPTRITDPRRVVLLAGDEPVGLLMGRLSDAPTSVPVAVIGALYVEPGRRSAGVGAALVRHFLDWARAQGAAYADVEAHTANERAVRFYRRQGMAPFLTTLRTRL